MLMAGVMTVLQPASIYAADMTEEQLMFEGESVSEDLQENPETVEDNGSPETLDDGGFISDFDTVDTEESVEDDSGGDAFIASNETVSEDVTAGEQNTQANPLSLTWDGIISECNDQNVMTEIRKEDGTELNSSEMLILNSISQDVKKKLENKIQKQMIGVSVLGAWAFNLARKDGSGNDIEKNAAYRIQIKMMDISKFKNMRLYHQKENGDMEEITFTSGVSENDMQKLEFVSSDGLGDFIFAHIEEDLTINNNVSADTSTNASTDKSTESNDVSVGSDLTSIYAGNEGVKPELSTSDNLQTDGQPNHSESESLQQPSTDLSPDSSATSIDEDLTINDNHAGQDSESKEGDCDSVNDVDIKNDNPETVQDNPQADDADASSNNDADGSDGLSPSSPDMTEDNTNTDDSNNDTVTPIDISEFHVSLVSGADKINDKYIWNPSDPAAGHSFIYRVSYTMSGTFSTDVGAFKIEVPLHILKDKDGNWADSLDCPYPLETELTDEDSPDFAYRIDEENNKAIIYNYNPYPTGEAGYIEISYSTSRPTIYYTDMGGSDELNATIYATNSNSTVTKDATAAPVYIDTHATISYTEKRVPTLYKQWSSSWGEKPADADEYLYLVWPIRTYISKSTSPYNFSLEDTFTSFEGSVVGYKFSGQSKFSEVNHIENVMGYSDRYDFVLTRHNKALAEAEMNSTAMLRYLVHNDVIATVDPIDQVDEDTTAKSSRDWWYETPRYIAPNGHFWAEKCGMYGQYPNVNRVRYSEDISDYTLAEFCAGDEDAINGLYYYTYANAYHYPWTLADGATGTVEDVTQKRYGQKKVNYDFTDDIFFVENERLDDADYDLTTAYWKPTVNDAAFDENSLSFYGTSITNYKPEDNITIWARTGTGWKQAAVYNLHDKTYENVDSGCITSAAREKINFAAGVKGVRFTASNAYYHNGA